VNFLSSSTLSGCRSMFCAISNTVVPVQASNALEISSKPQITLALAMSRNSSLVLWCQSCPWKAASPRQSVPPGRWWGRANVTVVRIGQHNSRILSHMHHRSQHRQSRTEVPLPPFFPQKLHTIFTVGNLATARTKTQKEVITPWNDFVGLGSFHSRGNQNMTRVSSCCETAPILHPPRNWSWERGSEKALMLFRHRGVQGNLQSYE